MLHAACACFYARVFMTKTMTNQIISKEGYDKLKKELEYLKTTHRLEIAKRIEKAKELGDLSENAEYAEAKDEQAFNDGRIAEITALLKNVTVVENGHNKDIIGMGSKVIVKNCDTEKQYTIVSFNEADPLNGKISNESPLGRALLDRKKNERVKVETPNGEMEYEILNIG
ncbi:MAG: transcription elongation factor GreA [bacterium]|nr:transcription elongation factor GreA [bacterium]